MPNAAYGASKALLPWYIIRITAEDDWLTAFVLDPGFVRRKLVIPLRGPLAWEKLLIRLRNPRTV